MTVPFAMPDRPDGRSQRAMPRAETDRMFRAAARHSKLVRILRVAVPVSVVVILGVIVTAVFFNPLRMLTNLPIDPSKLTISGTKVTMQSPRLAGFTGDSRSYELTADAASQDVTRPDLLELKGIYAKLEMQNKTYVEMTATSGVFDRRIDRITLNERIQLTSTTGYEARLSQAFIDVKTGGVVSLYPVEVQMLNGTLNANRLEVVSAGEVVRFDGGVALTVMLDSAAPIRKAAP